MQGKELLIWSHKDVKEFMKRRYLLSTTDRTKCHLDFAHLFMDSTKEDTDEFGSEIFVLDFNGSLTCPQPLAYSSFMYNYRTIEELWIQLLYSGIYILKGSSFARSLNEYHCQSNHPSSHCKITQ